MKFLRRFFVHTNFLQHPSLDMLIKQNKTKFYLSKIQEMSVSMYRIQEMHMYLNVCLFQPVFTSQCLLCRCISGISM